MNRYATIIAGAPRVGWDDYYRTVALEATYLVAADSGAEICRIAGRAPDLLVGDMDSVSDETLQWVERLGGEVVRVPAEKDFSDLDLALKLVADAGFATAQVCAAWSGRVDHTLAALGSVARSESLVIDLVDPCLAGWILRSKGSRNRIELTGPGATCSIFAIEQSAVITTSGMRYELSEGILTPLSSQGLSNVLVGDRAAVEVHSGVAAVLSSPLEGGTIARTWRDG